MMKILDAYRKKDMNDKKFMAQIQGVSLDQDEPAGDLADLRGAQASQSGFGIGMGIGYSSEGE